MDQRLCLHVETVLIYSRNSENVTGKYPDIVEQVPKHLKPEIQSIVLDCETVPFDAQEQKILPFQVLSNRFYGTLFIHVPFTEVEYTSKKGCDIGQHQSARLYLLL